MSTENVFFQERIDEISDESRIITDRLDEFRSAGGAAR